jgi:peptidyl-prolyl cis-trans isomerase B (cyclophilin B)
MSRFILMLCTCVLLFSACNKDGYTYAEIETDFGTIKVRLYNSTPKHRDNFIELANQNYYDDLLFHRVISGFMIQGGDPDSKGAAPGVHLGGGGPGYQVDAEIGALHIKGALAAARTDNPEKKSSGSQY